MIIYSQNHIICPIPGRTMFTFPKEEVEAIDFPKDNIAVYGLSYWHREIRERLYDEVRPANGKRINLFLAHGGDEKHIPCNPTTFVNNGFDYTMMGHIHKGGQLIPGKVTMAGALEPTDCNDFECMVIGWENWKKDTVYFSFSQSKNASTVWKRFRLSKRQRGVRY